MRKQIFSQESHNQRPQFPQVLVPEEQKLNEPTLNNTAATFDENQLFSYSFHVEGFKRLCEDDINEIKNLASCQELQLSYEVRRFPHPKEPKISIYHKICLQGSKLTYFQKKAIREQITDIIKGVELKHPFHSEVDRKIYMNFIHKKLKAELKGKGIGLVCKEADSLLTIQGPERKVNMVKQEIRDCIKQINSHASYIYDVKIRGLFAVKILESLSYPENEPFFLHYFEKIYSKFPNIKLLALTETLPRKEKLLIHALYENDEESHSAFEALKALENAFSQIISRSILLDSRLSDYLEKGEMTKGKLKKLHVVIINEFFQKRANKWRVCLIGEERNVESALKTISTLKNEIKDTKEKIDPKSKSRPALLKSDMTDLFSLKVETFKKKKSKIIIKTKSINSQEGQDELTNITKKRMDFECEELNFGLLDPYVQSLNPSKLDLNYYVLPHQKVPRARFVVRNGSGREELFIINFASQNKDEYRIIFRPKDCKIVYYEASDNNQTELYFQLKNISSYSKSPKEDLFRFSFEFTKDTLFADYLDAFMVVRVAFDKEVDFKELKDMLKESNLERLTEPLNKIFIKEDGFPNLTDTIFDESKLSFDIRFALKACIMHKKASLFEITPEFLKMLEQLDANIVQKTLEDLARKPRQSSYFKGCYTKKSFGEIFEALYAENKKRRSYWENIKNISQFITVKRVVLTPSRIIYNVGKPQLSNAIVGRFKAYEHCFLRVVFTDEEGEKPISVNKKARIRFREFLNGLKIMEKPYKFLACSASQLKRCAVWMFCEDEGLNVEAIHQEMGDFSSIMTPSKRGARLGQLFSQSIMSLKLDVNLERIEDIKTECKQYIFSDGIGKVSSNVLKLVQKMFHKKGKISAIQIRYRGCKGMLVENANLEDNTLCIRESMEKFPSEFNKNVIEVLDYSKYAPACLNRQIIILLLANGIQDYVFEEIRNQNISDLKEEKLTKKFLYYVKNEAILAPIKPLLKNCINKEINVTTEPFLKRVIETIRIRHFFADMGSECNFVVEEAATLFGVIDEYGILGPDEVFICISPSNGRKKSDFQVIDSEVIVTKFPCLFPGDIRVLKAVNHSEAQEKFKDIINCIVFPAKGDRPRTDEISGSDLDGDKYFISWNKDLIPLPAHRGKPMSFKAQTAKESAHVSLEDIKDFFFEFLENDKVGQIATSHMAIADAYLCENLPFGSIDLSEECYKHGEEHSIAVDYAKNGVPSKMKEGFAKKWPDHMKKGGTKSYESQLIMGKAYRETKKMIDEFQIESLTIRELYKQGLQRSREEISIDEHVVVQGFEHYLPQAFSAIKVFYDKTLAFMDSYSIKTEYEIYSGNFLKFADKKKNKKCKRYGEIERLQDIAASHVEFIKQLAGNMLIDNFKERVNDGESKELILQVATAVYIATYYLFNEEKNPTFKAVMEEIKYETEIKPMFEEYDVQLLGLPWYLFPDVLVELQAKSPNVKN